jgi:hypothetical protein
MAIELLTAIAVCGESPGVSQNSMTLAINAPIVIPGHDDLPNKMMSANAIPEGGHAGKEEVCSKTKKYPSLANK